MEQPVYFGNPDIAPSGLIHGSLLGKLLVRLRLAHVRVVFEERLMMELGLRVRDVRQGPDQGCTL